MQEHVGEDELRRRAHDDQKHMAHGPSRRAEEFLRNQREQDQGQDAGGDEGDLRQQQGRDHAGKHLVQEQGPCPVPQIAPGLAVQESSQAQGRGHDIDGQKPDDVAHFDGRAAAQQERRAEHIEADEFRAHPKAQGGDEQVEDDQQGRGLRIIAFAEGRFQMEPQGRQADETQHDAGAQPAFEPVAGVSLDVHPDIRQAGEEKGGDDACLPRQDPEHRQFRLFQRFRIDLGADAGVGNGDGQHPGER